MTETCALIIGRKFGKHNFSYFISPKKTLEGLFGQCLGVFVGIALFVFMCWMFNVPKADFTVGDLFHMAIYICIVGILGDLAESLVKRAVNVKDSSSIAIVGKLGGILDKFDSFGVSWLTMSVILRFIRPALSPY